MISRTLAWFFICACFQFTFAQTLFINDATNGNAIENASIFQMSAKQFVISNYKGEADISSFKNLDSIQISCLGYERIYTSYAALSAANFKLQLQPEDVAINEVIVSSYKEQLRVESSQQIEVLTIKKIDELGAFTLSDALSHVLGVSQFSTGLGISKPVIRGLHGNRILVLFNSLRFDNQQWQDEHGLGISNMGISKTEIIKGPMSVLYGTDAVGGIVNIIEEKAPAEGTWVSDVQTSGNSNTLGGALQLGTKANFGNKWFRARFEITNHADYTDGNNDRVLNSRFKGLCFKGSYGFKRQHWQSENHYYLSNSKYGFVFNDLLHFMEADGRYSRAMTGPHHNVMLNTISSLNSFTLKQSVLKFNTGLQSNLRSEDEGGGALSLKMHLFTYQYSLKWNKDFNENWQFVLAQNSVLENNTNLGRRKIIPDAWMIENTVSAYAKQHYKKFIFEYGAGLGNKWIKTGLTPGVNSAEKEIEPFSQSRIFFNGLFGVCYHPNKKWNVALNFSSGVRAPNLAELSSNGLHEGTYQYELGNPNLKNEQNANTEMQVQFFGKQVEFSASGFYNYFADFIYLQPSNEEWFGFPKYYYVQDKAMLFGTENSIKYVPSYARSIVLQITHNQVVGKLFDGTFLPWMPAQKITPEIRYDYKKSNINAYVFLNSPVMLKQNRLHATENETPKYNLLNAGMGCTINKQNIVYQINLVGNNLLNKAYFDHLSRLKNYGFLNIGRNINLQFKIQFIKQLKKQKQ